MITPVPNCLRIVKTMLIFFGSAFCRNIGAKTPTTHFVNSAFDRLEILGKLTNGACGQNNEQQANAKTNVIISFS